jgi:hypothetical protein
MPADTGMLQMAENEDKGTFRVLIEQHQQTHATLELTSPALASP